MAEPRSIDREIDLEPALDYSFLRAEGLQHIQQLSGLLWTDHNTHDPGITMLEVLCYALTDLAYRTGFDTRDLMTCPKGNMDPADKSGLFPAHEVLTTAPRTIADYRRLLLRIEGVRNVWLDPMTDPAEPDRYRLSEVPIYADCTADALSYDPVDAAGRENHPVQLSGLYKVLVELEIDDELGSMNEPTLIYRVRRGNLKGAVLSFDCTDPAFVEGSLDLSRDLVGVKVVTVSTQPGGFAAQLELKYGSGPDVTLDPCFIRVIKDRPHPGRAPLTITAQGLRTVLGGSLADDLVPFYWLKQQRRARAFGAVACVLHAHRGLCEDFLSIASIAPHRIGICADVEVKPDADLEMIQATLYHEIEKYLSAPVRYRTLKEMLEADHQPDAIFNGPYVDFGLKCDGQPVFTKPGFILDEDLAASELRRRVLASDIINIAVDIEGVEAISDVQLSVYDHNGVVVGSSEKWSLTVPPDHQPVFFMPGSKILFRRGGLPYRAQVTEFERTLDHFRALDERQLHVAPDQILSAPRGKWRKLDKYYSVQHDFPATYKIGTAGISTSEKRKRVVQARQLKGYLTFFDQVLADYLGQLANLRRIYSLDETLDRTWFSQYVKDVAGSHGDFETEFYADNLLADDMKRIRLTESEEAFLDRRNRVLDHLIARFAERFADYALFAFRRSGDRLTTSAQLIKDKIDFLKDYPALSRGRGMGANIRPENRSAAWDSDNISGLERRVGRLLGLDGLTRRNLHCDGHFSKLITTPKTSNVFRIVIRDARRKVLFGSAEIFPTEETAKKAAAVAYSNLRDEAAFEIAPLPGAAAFTMKIMTGPLPLTHVGRFRSETAAIRAARAIIDRYDELLADDDCDSEGMHLIEHILLRPLASGDKLMSVCLGEDCSFCGEEDSYSFRASVVLPYWPKRFRDPHFRALVERTLREEAPAHVQLRICWISQQAMTELDAAYRAWLAARAAPKPNSTTVRNRSRKLIEVLESLNSVYPAASLHDCDVGDDEAIVRLGATALGIF